MTDSDSDVTRVVSGMGGPAIAYRRFGSVSTAPIAPQDVAAGETSMPAPSGSAAAMFSLLGAALPEAAEIGVGAAAPPVPEAPPPAALRAEPVPVAPPPSPIPVAPLIPAAPPAAPASASPFPTRVAVPAPLAAGPRVSLGDMFRVLSDRPPEAAAPGNPFPFRRR